MVAQRWNSPPLAPLYVRNRRDGSRLLSSALVIFTIAATQLHTSWGCGSAAVSALVCIYWGFAYRRLER
ncbi:hypothetical protein [Synechococcus sp. MIT S1220]|uniref:hypothetical protein n=1 Tax=Synechococcus sp. MIT S1220 TaxID=3082549 RepID=UPI0039AFC3B5